MRFTTGKILAILKKHGYKLTSQRRLVIQVITSFQGYFTPAAIYKKVHQDHPSIGFTTIYRTLDMLTRLNLICELHAGGSCQSYTTSSPEHHHHLICSNCRRVTDFTGYDLGELQARLSKGTGFKIDSHLLEFTGVCQTCQKETT